jgi:hypothetical protein
MGSNQSSYGLGPGQTTKSMGSGQNESSKSGLPTRIQRVEVEMVSCTAAASAVGPQGTLLFFFITFVAEIAYINLLLICHKRGHRCFSFVLQIS